MVVSGRPLKRMKRRVTADLHDFLTFPAGDDVPGGPFRTSVRWFLSKHTCLPSVVAPAVFPHLMTWQIVFRIGDPGASPPHVPASEPTVALDVVEEDVARSRSLYCDQCRVVGWSGHPVCRKRYHFIIRANRSAVDSYHQPCTGCGVSLHSSDLRHKSCNYQITEDDLEDWVYLQLADTTHLLHGVVHTNGYGHLLRINGREGGSKYLSGCHIMDFWDRLCKMLKVRKISVMDVSKKYGLEYRLLHAITNDHPWYGDWDYEFGSGSFALTANAYREAVNALSNMPLSTFFTHERTSRTHLQDVIAFYMSLSEHKVETARDLFCFITGLLHNIHKQAGAFSKRVVHTNALLCARRADDIDKVEGAMFKVLCAVGKSRWVSWRALRGAVCRAGPPEMLDYCLKQIAGKSINSKVVHMRCNPETDMIEYRVEDGNNTELGNNAADSAMLSHNSLTEDRLLRDLKFLYDALLHPDTMLCYRPQGTRELALSSASKLLDCKQFVKDYESHSIKMTNPHIKVWCNAMLFNQPKDYTAPPPELVVLPVTATVADLKREATKAFQEAYLLFKRFEAEQLLDYGEVSDSTHVKFLIGLEGSVRIGGRCYVNHGLHRFRMERGIENWTVNCACGARDDDGERMLACDECGVWQHTRCSGIHDFETVPAKFICKRC